jgi:hypothetical protein
MRAILLSIMIGLLAAAEPAWTPILDSRFDGSIALVPIPADSKNASGSLPNGAREDSNWAELKIAYEAGKDAAGAAFLRATMSEWKKGEAQLKYRLPKLDPGTWRLVVNAASPSKNKLTFGISDNGPPYKQHIKQVLALKAEAGEQTVEFEVGALEGAKALLVRLGNAGTVELRSIRLERRH